MFHSTTYPFCRYTLQSYICQNILFTNIFSKNQIFFIKNHCFLWYFFSFCCRRRRLRPEGWRKTTIRTKKREHTSNTAKSNFRPFRKSGGLDITEFLPEISEKNMNVIILLFWNVISKFCNIRSVRFFWNFKNYLLQCGRWKTAANLEPSGLLLQGRSISVIFFFCLNFFSFFVSVHKFLSIVGST